MGSRSSHSGAMIDRPDSLEDAPLLLPLPGLRESHKNNLKICNGPNYSTFLKISKFDKKCLELEIYLHVTKFFRKQVFCGTEVVKIFLRVNI